MVSKMILGSWSGGEHQSSNRKKTEEGVVDGKIETEADSVTKGRKVQCTKNEAKASLRGVGDTDLCTLVQNMGRRARKCVSPPKH